MNLSDPEKQKQRLWNQPLQVPSRSENDAEDSVLLSSIQQQQQHRAGRPPDISHFSSNRISGRGRDGKRQRGGNGTPSKAPGYQANNVSSLGLPIPRGEASMLPVLRLRPLSLDRGAIAPGLASPTAPFARSEKSRAFVSAIYYSECFLRNIRPIDADLAAFDAQNQYTKWWVQSKKSSASTSHLSQHIVQRKEGVDDKVTSKRRRLNQNRTSNVDQTTNPPLERSPSPVISQEQLSLLKERLLDNLQKTGGDTTADEFRYCLELLQSIHVKRNTDSAPIADPETTSRILSSMSNEGTWLTLSKPTFSECLGRNEKGEYLYTLGRMAFDMFRPNKLKCSIRAVMNNIHVMNPNHKPKSFPSRLRKELEEHSRATASNPIHHYE